MGVERPNIVYIFTDQQTAAAMSCAGNRDLNTPVMDGLAARGVRFENVYCTYPLCTPSRASMFTGCMPHQVGVKTNGDSIAEAFRSNELGHVLGRAGYDCVYGGKWHVPEIAMPEGHGFRTICGFSDTDLAEHCVAFLRQPHEKPFFLVASYDNPHNICEWARNTSLPWGPIEAAPVSVCPNLPVNFGPGAYEPEVLRLHQAVNAQVYRAAAYTDDDWRRHRHAYYRLVEKVDTEIGRILDGLNAAGLAENTLVVFSSDHGDVLGSHRWNQKTALYEEAVCVPLILSWPGRIREHAVDTEHLVSNGLDLFPTFCDYAGVPLPNGLPGLSLRSVAETGAANGWRDHLVSETQLGPDAAAGTTHGRMVRTDRYKYVLYSWGKYREQLFDLIEDPGEMVNLAVEMRYDDVLARHRALLVDWLERTDDRFEAHYSHPGMRPLVPGEEYVPAGQG